MYFCDALSVNFREAVKDSKHRSMADKHLIIDKAISSVTKNTDGERQIKSISVINLIWSYER